MDLAQILRELSRHRLWLIPGAVIAVFAGILTAYTLSLSPPGLDKRAIELGAGQTDVVLDSVNSTIIDSSLGLEPLITRAPIYAQLMSSAPVTTAIARTAKVPPQLLVADSAGGGAAAPARSNEVLQEKQSYRLFFQVQEDQPLITISSQAPTAEKAVALANAAAKTFASYIKRRQEAQKVPKSRRIEVRQLGAAQGGVLNPGVNLVVAILVTIAAFIGFCLLVLLASNVARNIRESRVLGDPSGVDEAAPLVSWESRRRATGRRTPPDPEDGIDDEPAEAGTASRRGSGRR